jgi:hypothetical protein
MGRSLEEEPPSEPIRLETDGVFDSAGYPFPELDPETLMDNPMLALLKPLIQYFESIKPPMAFTMPPKSEHKIRIFRFKDSLGIASIDSIERTIENMLNDGYCCHMPTVVGDFVIMDFSRRKETEENEREQ